MQGFKEGPIMFKPTFKYWNNTNNYQYIDTHKIDQAPASTDRILYKKNVTSTNIFLLLILHLFLLCFLILPFANLIYLLFLNQLFQLNK